MNQTDKIGFRLWLENFEIHEITKPELIDTSDVKLTKFEDIKFDLNKAREYCASISGMENKDMEGCIEDQRWYHRQVSSKPGYLYAYEYDNKPFEVELVRDPEAGEKIKSILGKRSFVYSKDFWKIDLKGPKAFGLTGESGSAAMGVYLRMLAAVKKLMEMENPQGFVVMPAHDFMEPVYKRFVDSFLSKSFVLLDDHIYVRRDIVDSAEEHRKENVGRIAAQVSTKMDKRIRRIKWLKTLYRNLASSPQRYIGKIVGFEVNNRVVPAVIRNITMTEGIQLVVERSGFMRPFHVEPSDYHRIRHPDDIIAKVLSDVRREASDKRTNIGSVIATIPNYDGTTTVLPELPQDLMPLPGENEE